VVHKVRPKRRTIRPGQANGDHRQANKAQKHFEHGTENLADFQLEARLDCFDLHQQPIAKHRST
jgi:hypothetical protein